MAARIEFEGEALKDIIDSYKNGMGMGDLAASYEVSVGTIRRVLIDAKITIRKVGRPTQG